MGSIEITRAAEQDLDTIVALNGEVQGIHVAARPDIFRPVPPAELRDTFLGFLRGENTEILIARLDGEAVGYAVVRVWSRPEHAFCHDRSCVYIDQVAVKKAHRGRGVGGRLLAEAKQLALRNGMQRVELDVWTFNAEAKAFFAGQGFEVYNEKMALTLA